MHIFSNWAAYSALKYILAKQKPHRKPFLYRSGAGDSIVGNPGSFQGTNQNRLCVLRVSEIWLISSFFEYKGSLRLQI